MHNCENCNVIIKYIQKEVFPQGFSAVADRLRDFKGVNMLCDIGNGTMNVMYINNGKPVPSKCFTEKYGTHQCMLAVRESLMQKFGTAVDDSVIENVLRFGTADIGEKYLSVIRSTATEYVSGIMRRLREHEYNPELMRLYVMGGGYRKPLKRACPLLPPCSLHSSFRMCSRRQHRRKRHWWTTRTMTRQWTLLTACKIKLNSETFIDNVSVNRYNNSKGR